MSKPSEELPRFPYPFGKHWIAENGYSICRAEDGGYWVENPDGEGCHFTSEMMGAMLEEIFKKHF